MEIYRTKVAMTMRIAQDATKFRERDVTCNANRIELIFNFMRIEHVFCCI